jgi:hypothetical protein
VTAPVVFGRHHVLPAAMEFLKAYPDIDLLVVLTDHVLNLLEDHLDLAFRIGILPDSSLIATRIGSTRHVVCASPKYFAARGRPRRPDDLSDHACITFENLASPRAWKFNSAKGARAVPVRSRPSRRRSRHRAAVAGVGITRVLSYMIEDARRAGALEITLRRSNRRHAGDIVYAGGAPPSSPRLLLGGATAQSTAAWVGDLRPRKLAMKLFVTGGTGAMGRYVTGAGGAGFWVTVLAAAMTRPRRSRRRAPRQRVDLFDARSSARAIIGSGHCISRTRSGSGRRAGRARRHYNVTDGR